MKTYRKSTQRTHAMPSSYFEDMQDVASTLSTLRDTVGKSCRQRKRDARQAHAIEKRLTERAEGLYDTLQDTSNFTANWSHNPHGKKVWRVQCDNRIFHTAELRDLNYTPQHSRVGGMGETSFDQKYRKDRFMLDSQLSKRGRN